MDKNQTKKILKPAACTLPPWAVHIKSENKKDILLKIRQETLQHYGYSMDECPKRLTCFGKSCLGRELPWQSKAAKPYLEALKKTHNIVNGELFLSNCDVCPLAINCNSPCAQINDYLERDKTKQIDIDYSENVEALILEPEVNHFNKLINLKSLPWDCLTQRRQSTVKKYLYENKDFLTVANETGLYNQASAKYEFYAALTKLAKYATIREFLVSNELNLKDSHKELLYKVYTLNMSLTEVAKENNMSKQAIQRKIKNIFIKYKLKWPIFVKKNNNKVKYYPKGLVG